MTRSPDGGETPPRDENEDGAIEEPEETGVDEPAPATYAGRRAAGADDLDDEPDADDLDDEPDADDLDDEPDDADLGDDEPDEADLGDEPDLEELDDEDLEDDDGYGDDDEFDDDVEIPPVVDEAEPADSADDSQATVEANTLAIADREEAKEAALEGLRARAAASAAKREGSKPDAGEETEAPAVEPGEEEAEAEAEAAPVAVAAATTTGDDEDEGKPPRRSLWARFVAASFLIVVSMATATAVSLLVFLGGVVKGLGGLESVRGQLTAVEGGEPQNFLILGSDRRPGETDKGRSDTTILLRVNPDHAITLMSIPRDLKVNIPGHGIDKFNAAYTYGGPDLTLRVVRQLTQDRIPINHVVNVDFLGFADAVNAIGCVYVDVDHHYYHSNVGLAAAEQYAEIDVEAGYQRLCGLKALEYVRYRHEDNDLVRSARQQDFLREARAGVPPSKLLSDSNDLIEIFKTYTTSDIDRIDTLVNLLKLMLAARNAPVQEVHFPTTSLGDASGYVTSSSEQVQHAVSLFLGANEPTSPSSGGNGGGGGGGGGSGGGGGQKPEPPPAPTTEVPLIDSTATGQQYAASLQSAKLKSGKPTLDFPVYYPTKLVPNSAITDDSRAFVIDGPGNDVYHGYKMVVSVPGTSFPTAYYGVSGTDWKDPPILDNPSDERDIDGRHYLLFFDGDRLRMVGWKTDKASYWVNNTLTQQLGIGQMLAIAQNVREYTG